MTIHIEYEAEKRFPFDYETLLKRVVEEACDYVDCPYEIELNIVITGREEIQEINREYRNINAPTDVLSFPMLEYPAPGDFSEIEQLEEMADFNPDTGELLLGDIMLNYEQVVSQAQEFGHSVQRELAFLTAHSMFHLFGYDHIEEEERVLMEAKQKEFMDRLGKL